MAFGDVRQTVTAEAGAAGSITPDFANGDDLVPVEGNLLVARVYAGAGGGLTWAAAPSGWTLINQEGAARGAIGMYARIAGASEPKSETFSLASSTGDLVAILTEFEGPWAAFGNQVSATATSGNGAVGSQTSGTTGTPSFADGLAVAGVSALGTITFSGWTNGYVEDDEVAGAGNGSIGGASEVQSAAAAQETTATLSSGTRAKGIICVFEKGAGGTTFEDFPVFAGSGLLDVADSLAAVDTPTFAAAGGLTVADTFIPAGGTTFEDFPVFAGSGLLDVADSLAAVDTPTFAGTGRLTVLDSWSGDMNLTGVVWRVEIALATPGGVGSLWDSGLWDTTGVWAGTEPDWVPVTADVVAFNTNMGRDRFEDRMRTAAATVVLSNSTGRFNPDHGATPPGDLSLRPGRLVRVSGNVGTGYIPVFRGVIDDMPESYFDAGAEIETTLVCVGPAAQLQADDPPALGSPVGAGETTSARVERVLDEYGWDADRRNIQAGAHTLIGSTLARSSLEEIQRAADNEGGAFWIDAEGNAVFKAFDWLSNDARSTNVQMFPGRGSSGDPGVLKVDTDWTLQTIVNDVQYTRVGSSMIRVQDTISQSLYGPRTKRLTDLEVENDTQVTALADAVIAARAYDRLRIVGLTLDGTLDHAAALALLTTQLGDLVEVTVATLRGWSYTVQCHVMGIRFAATADDWSATLRVDDAVTYEP